MIRVAIIGAGLSGLSLAHLLRDKAEVILFEKARGVSGRMSTRRAEPFFFDSKLTHLKNFSRKTLILVT